VTLPPIIKKVERNGRTLVYRVQESSVDQEVSSASAPNLKSQPVKSSKNLVRRVTGEGTSYPSMVVDVDEDIEGKYFLITAEYSLNLTTATEPLYPDVNPARAKETKQKKIPEGKQLEKETHGTKRKESPTTTSSETTVVTKSIKLEGSGSRGRVRTADFNELARSIIEETISIYRAQIGGVDPFPERTDDRDTVKQAWVEVCSGRNVQVELEEDMFKLVSDYNYYSVLIVAMISLCRLLVVLRKHEAMLKLYLSHISYRRTRSTAMDQNARPATALNRF
jgi:hypothetical protein